MRHNTLSLAMAGLAILLLATTAFAQTTFVTTGRVDTITGISQSQGVPSVASGTFIPQVRAMDPIAANMGEPWVSYMADLDTYFASNYGWRPPVQTSVLLYSNAQGLISDLQTFRGGNIGDVVQFNTLSRPAVLTQVSQSNGLIPQGQWAILVNLDMDAANETFNRIAFQFNAINFQIPNNQNLTGQGGLVPGVNIAVTGAQDQAALQAQNAMIMIQESVAREYSSLMIMNLAGTSAPAWFSEGLADAIAFSIVPGAPQEQGETLAVARFQQQNNNLPTLFQLQDAWNFFGGTGGLTSAMARGIGLLSSRTLISGLSGGQIASLLQNVGSGSSFESQLQSFTGFDLGSLNIQYQGLIPIP